MASVAEAELTEPQVRIVRAAYRLIGARGVQRVSLEEIAIGAGVSKGLVLYHFRSRERLLLAMMRWVLEAVAARIRDAVEAAHTPREQIAAMLDVIFASAESNRRYYLTYIEMVEHGARFEAFGKLVSAVAGIQDQTYAAVVRAGMASGDFEPRDVQQTARAVRGLVEGLFLQWLQEPEWRDAHGAYRALAEDGVLNYLAPKNHAFAGRPD
jgi:TetR/AcrR family transcriptional regulator, fatty acid metabolism regulator protein